MFQKFAILRGARTGSIRSVCLPCLLLVLAIVSAPLFSAPDVEVPADTALAVIVPDSSSASLSDLKPGDQVLVASSGFDLDKLKDIIQPGGVLTIGRGRPTKVKHPDLSKTPGRLMTAGLLMLPLDTGLVKLMPRDGSNQKPDGFTEAVNMLGDGKVLISALGGMYLIGDKDDKDTAKLALAALVNAGIVTQGIKMVTGRARPGVADEGEFSGPGGGEGYASFPSGHTSAAFAVATVLANRHPKQKWLYYGLATAVGYARVRKSAHFPSDVLVGAAIGINAGNSVLRNGPSIFSIKL